VVETVSVLGVNVSAVNTTVVLTEVDRWIAEGRRHYICVTGAHGVIECQGDKELLRIHNRAGLVVPDGMPVVWVSRLRGFRQVSRVCGRELMLALCEHSVPRRYRHFFYGGGSGIGELLSQKVCQRFPGLTVVGSITPPFRPLTLEEDDKVVAEINAARPDVLWIGLSTPKQERWMASHRDVISAPVMLGVGAAFDFNSEVKRSAPVWMQHNGLEWAFRLASEPRRLWRRYAYIVPAFIALNLLQFLGLQSFPIAPAQGAATGAKLGISHGRRPRR
jgi:N-acetylglucosaminyldiphosphoundecaprenol N-acetyl-beta-D-mannosaminyltransferase